MVNEETNRILLSTRATGASTPNYAHIEALKEFLNRDDSLQFSPSADIYSQILEERDDTLFRWYPMYIHYARKERAVRVNQELHDRGYETYLHLQEPPKDYFGTPLKGTNKGPVYSIVFVHAMKIQLKLLKRFNGTCRMLKFMSSASLTDHAATRIIWVPDRQMENFIEAASRPDPLSQRIPLTYNDFIDKEGQKVKIVDGPFTGIMGEIKRIGRHRIVVALVRDARVAIGITHIAPEYLEILQD